jgi:hypothetical protein
VNLRSRRILLLTLAASAVVLFAFGILAAYVTRHDTICPDRKPPVAQQGGLLGQTEYLCHDGRVVTK